MAHHILKKMLSIIPLLLLVSVILFGLISMLPGNAAMAIIGEGASTDQLRRLEAQMGLDQPVYMQYLNWLVKTLGGDFGTSLITEQPVTQRISERLPVSIEFMSLSMLLGVVVAIPISVLCAVKRNSFFDYLASVVSMLGVAMPGFWLGILLILLFSVHLRWLPASGYVPFFEDPLQNIRLMIMPVCSIAFAFAGTVVRQTRSALLEVLGQDYITTARAKGLRNCVILVKHALRNALIPVITVVSLQIGRMIGGAVVIETVYLLPGMGKLLVDAIYQRDYPVVMAQVLFLALIVVLVNTVVDILYIIIDPRISHRSESR